MTPKPVLVASAIYLGILGLGFLLFPREIGIGAVPADASPALVAYLRIFGGPCLGIATLNWLARNAEPSTARRAILIANTVGFACVTATDVWGVFGGGARAVAKLFLVVHLSLALAFLSAWRSARREG